MTIALLHTAPTPHFVHPQDLLLIVLALAGVAAFQLLRKQFSD